MDMERWMWMKDWTWMGGSRLSRLFRDKNLYIMLSYNEQDKLWEWKLYKVIPGDWQTLHVGKASSARLAVEQSVTAMLEVEV